MEIERTLHDLGNGVFGYTQLPGTWGWSNSGLVTDGDQALLVDTLFDLTITARMLATMRDAAPAARNIGTVVNTHGNGDHCYGNGAVEGAEIVATTGCLEELRRSPPSRNQTLLSAGGLLMRLGPVGTAMAGLTRALGFPALANLADAAPLAVPLFEAFNFKGNDVVLPTRTFDGELELTVGDKTVQLIEVGPAHTNGDAVAYVPQDKVLFTGDILFKDAHPLVWEGPVSNWIAACDRILGMDIDVIVPGHGPVCDLQGIREQKAYLEWLTAETRARYEAGMDVESACRDIALGEYANWLDSERIYVNVHTLYRDFEDDREAADILALFAGMGRLHRDQRG